MKTRNGAHTADAWVIPPHIASIASCSSPAQPDFGVSTAARCPRYFVTAAATLDVAEFALLGVWGRALIDLATTAASERMKEGLQMSRPVFIRIAGLAGLIAGPGMHFSL